MPGRLRVAFVCTEVAGVAFYRIVQPARYLEKNGCDVKVLGYKKDAWKRPEWEGLSEIDYADVVKFDVQRACKWADVVVWMALHTTDSFRLFTDMREAYPDKPFVMELDDIVFSIPAANIASTVYYPGSPLTAISFAQMKLSDAMIVSTPGLKEQLAPYNARIHVAPNAIDLSLWRKKSSPARRRVTIGWVGGGTHTEDLATVKEPLFEVLRRHPQAVFRCVHGCPEFFKHKADCPWIETNDPRYDKTRPCTKCGGLDQVEWTHEFKPVEKYPKWVAGQRFDIGIAPLEDNNFNRAKSNLRWLEYSAMGIPTVASPVGHFAETISTGRNGFLAHTPVEWTDWLSTLVLSSELRERTGRLAQEEVKKQWNPQSLGRHYKTVLKGIIHAVTHSKRARDPNPNADRGRERAAV